ncbi:MAG: DUF1508 domain-containing protein [Actinobacteria bacterium]|nr:DUF1508 domain-containing protein [Actinomycetota bacterium]
MAESESTAHADAPRPQVFQRADGRWAWRLRAANGEIIATDGGQGFERHGAAKASAAAVLSGRYAVTDD